MNLAESGFEAWNDAFPPPVHAGVPQPLTPTSVFLFEDLVLRGVAGSPSGWQWFDSPRHLTGYLLHVCIPDLAAWWFDNSKFLNANNRMPLRDTIESAVDADPDDRAVLVGIADGLEAVLAGPDPIDFGAVSRILEGFTDRFGDTPRGAFTLLAFPDTVAAGVALWEGLEGELPSLDDDCTESRWLDLCARAGAEPAAAQVVSGAFEDDHSV